MKLEEIEKITSEATPGPWVDEACPSKKRIEIISDAAERIVLFSPTSKDARFACMARTELPKLIAFVKAWDRLEYENDNAETSVPIIAASKALDDARKELEN